MVLNNRRRLAQASVAPFSSLVLMVTLLGYFGLDTGPTLVSAQLPAGTDPVQLYRFEMQPLNELIDTTLTVFRGTLALSVKPPLWILEFDAGAPTDFVLTNARRWPTQSADVPSSFRSDYASEMAYFHLRDSTQVYDSCCTWTPAYDPYFIPILQEFYGIMLAGKPVVFKTTSIQYTTTNLSAWFTSWKQLEEGACPLRCLAPVDIVFSTDSSESVDFISGFGQVNGPNWNLMRSFVQEFTRRYFFTTDQETAKLAYLQFSGFKSLKFGGPLYNARTFNDNYTNTDRICTVKTADPTSLNSSDWGVANLTTVLSNLAEWDNLECVDGLDWDDVATQNTYGYPNCASKDGNNVNCGQGWVLVEGLFSGNAAYIDYVLQRTINSGLELTIPVFGPQSLDCTRCLIKTSIGLSIQAAGELLSQNSRGVQRIIITLTDGVENVGISIQDAVVITEELLNADPGPKVRLVSVGIGDTNDTQLVKAAGGDERNVLKAANYSALLPLLPRLLSLSCDERWDLCQSTCAGICSPCGDCLCPACPDLECKLSIGCENGLCLYAEPETDCCESRLFELCERRGGTLNVAKGCVCEFLSDGENTAAVVGGSVGALVGICTSLLVALLLLCLLAILIVTVIILILKGRAIAAAIAALGSNAFGAGGAAANPTYEGMHTDGANPLYDADEEDGL